MNILFIYDSPMNPEKGGTERSTSLVMDELEKRGHKCLGFLHFNQDNPQEYFYNNVRVPCLLEFLTNHHIDVVVNQIAFHQWLLKAFLDNGGREWKSRGGKIISFMHFDPSDVPFNITNLFRDFGKKNLYAKVKRIGLLFYLPFLLKRMRKERHLSFRYIYEESDKYILMSKAFIPIFCKKAGIEYNEKLHVITNMLTFPTIQHKSILDTKDKRVIVVARLDEKQKKISTILKVWHQLKDHHTYILQIIGSGKDEQFYKDLVRKMGIKDVEFCGQQSPLDYYLKARIFLMSSPAEGWGLTITESMQNGVVPIVMNTSVVFQDIIDHKQNGFLAGSINEFREYLNKLLIHDTERRKIALNALNKVSQFCSSKVGDDWDNLLKQL